MDLYETLNKLNIDYIEINHEPVFTVLEAKKIKEKINGFGIKNLFLKNNKGKYFLVLLPEDKRANIKEVSALVNSGHLSFASPIELQNILGLTAGSVSPLGIINDKKNIVFVVIDKDLKDKKILVHPNINTKTIAIEFTDLIKLLDYENHNYLLM